MWRYHVKYRVAGLISDPLGYWFDPDVTDGSGIRKIQPQVEKFNLELNKKKLKKLQASSSKPQASSLTMVLGFDRIRF